MASVPNPSFEAGQAALKQGNYSVAIAYFEDVCETELDDSLISRASIGLVTAYRQSGDTQKAIALCQQLTQHPDSKVKQWAVSTLTNLAAGQPASGNPSVSDSTGFVPLEDTPPNPSTLDSTGFVSFNPAPSKPQTPQQVPPSKVKQPLADSTNHSSSSSNIQNSKFRTGKRVPPLETSSDVSELEHTQGNLDSPTADSSPVPIPSPSTPPSPITPHPRWRKSGRAKSWSPLKPIKLIRLWLVQIGTAIALFWVLHFLVQFLMRTTNTILVKLPLLNPFQLFYRDPTLGLLIVLAILLILSPWLMDALLKQFHGFKVLPLTQLASRCPDAAQVMQRFCRQRRLPVPKLGILPTKAPVALTYGNLPRTARIVVSEGLLEQLTDDEMATLYANQMGHIVNKDFILMSLGVSVIQLPYIIYWQVAQWGEALVSLINNKLPSYGRILSLLLLGITGVIASFSYGIYWLLRLPLLWFSRARVYYSDRLATETTGNPNGLSRALLKIALGITEDIQENRQTSGLLESFDLLLPIGYQQAITLGSCSPQTPFEAILNWDCTNPYRDWLIISASHPLIGERLTMLARYAQLWKLETELDLSPLAPPVRHHAAWLSKLKNSYKALPLLQTALLFGLLLGIALRVILWIIGKVSDLLNIWQLIWLHNADPFLNACILIAFSLSLFLWINGYFPDIKPATANVQTQPGLGDLYANPATLPPDSQPVQLTGTLLGRRGLFNWLGQDLILQTSTGLVKLHFFSFLGAVGNLLPQRTRPSNLVDQPVIVTGWFRRGVTPWIDIETLRTQAGKISRAHYPIWLTILAGVAAVWGAYLIWQVRP